MIHFLSLLLAGLFLSATPTSSAEPSIEGTWKHRDKPAWLDISFNSGVGTATVSRHEDNPDAEGAEILIEIRRNESSPLSWWAKMYSAAVDDFVEVGLELESPSSLVVTFGQEPVLRLQRQDSPPDESGRDR